MLAVDFDSRVGVVALPTKEDCARVLAPNEETILKNYSSAMAYAYLNADKDWDEWHKTGSTGGGGGLSYAGFALDFNGSQSAAEFQKKVRDYLTNIGFSLNKASSESVLRRYATDAQVAAWADCMRGDSVLMNVPEINRKRATVKASVRLTGVKEETLVVTVAGGTIDGKTKLRRSVTGLDSRIFIVVPDPRQKKVNLTAQAGGETDSVELDFGAEIQAGGMIGSLLSIARRAPLVTTPYTDWTPDTIVVSPLAAPYRWVASGQELMGVAATKYVISFEIAHKSQYMPRGTMGYDGFVITGFNRDIEKIEVANGTDLALDVKNTAREVRIDIRGFSEPGFGFALALTFKEN